MKFNINKYIKVKLNDKGYKHLASIHNEMLDKIPNWKKRDDNYYREKTDNDGYTKMQMWEFIQKFASVTVLGCELFYDADILFDISDFHE